MTALDRFSALVNEGKSVREVQQQADIELSSVDRYLRWVKDAGLVPEDVLIRGDYFVRDGKRFGTAAQQGITTYVIFGDTHCPYQDNRTIDVMCQIIADVRPDQVIENGDGLDCYLFSRFSKDPARAKTFQQERDVHKKYVVDKVKSASSATYLYLGGDEDNHYNRFLKDIVWENHLHDMPELAPAKILYLDDDEYQDGPIFLGKNTFRVSHGIRYGENAAKLDLRDYMISGLQNHNHRLSTYYRTTATKTYVYATNGHLSDVNNTYKKHPNWQAGFSILYMRPSGHFTLMQVPIVGHEAVFGGKLYTA